jgi:hypothetical protein
MAGYPRVVGHYPGTGLYGYPPPHHAHGYVAGGYVAGAYPEPPPYAMMRAYQEGGHLPIHPPPPPMVVAPPWRPMMAPGNPPLGEGHVPLPLTAETFGGTWGNTAGGGAAAGTTITFSARPQKPFKTARLIASGTKLGTTAVGRLIAQIFVGTSLQQAELGFFDLESIGAATAFDTWVSMHQAEPGVWIRVQGQLTAYPTGTDFETYVITALGHYLQ